MIDLIKNILRDLYLPDAINLTLVYDKPKSELMNGQYYDIMCEEYEVDEAIMSFNLVDYLEAYRQDGMSEAEVVARVIDNLVTEIDKIVFAE